MLSKKYKGFTLTEILVGLVLSGFLSLILINALRWVLLTGQKASRLLLARERGERVIAFIEQRIRHCAFGLGACKTRELFQKALGNGTGKSLSPLATSSQWPLIIYQDTSFKPAVNTNGVFKGAAFAVIYAQEAGLDIQIKNPELKILSPGQSAEYEKMHGDSDASRLISSREYQDIRSWCIMPSIGVPLHIDSFTVRGKLKLTLAASWPENIKLTPASNLYRLIAEQFFAVYNIFRFKRLQNTWEDLAFTGFPRERGILALYCEWRPAEKIFDLYILSSGGAAVFNKSSRPSDWPLDADWQNEFEQHELCVSKASWKIENLN